MTTTTDRAIAAARNQSTNGPRIDHWLNVDGPTGWCLKAVRTCYGIDALDFTPNNGRAPWAIEAFDHADHPHRTTNPATIPAGVPVFWRSRVAGKPGHIAISAGGGFCWSTDSKRDGYFDKVAITSVSSAWNMQLVGWTEDLNRVRVYIPPLPPTDVTRARALLERAKLKAGPIRRRKIAAMLAVGPKR